MEDKKDYKRFTISLPRDLFKEFEAYRKSINFSRSESIRKAMRTFMDSEEEILKSSGDVVGCLTMIMTHEHFFTSHEHLHEHEHEHSQDISPIEDNESKINTESHQYDTHHNHDYSVGSIYADVTQTDLIKNNDIQHHYADIIISTMHVHLAFDKCLEILAIQGPIERVITLKNALQKLKSIIKINLVLGLK